MAATARTGSLWSAPTSGPGGVLGGVALVWFLLELGTMLASEKRRALHDYIAGTVVIRAPQQVHIPDDPVEARAQDKEPGAR